MVDKVKPLKIENPSTGGTDTDPFPRETDPTADYLSTKGLAFEDLDTFRVEKLGRSLVEFFPSLYESITYASNKVSVIEYFNSSSFITANRLARRAFTYSGNDVTVETLLIYDTDGSTVLRTYTWTYSYTGSNLTSSALVIT